MKRKDLLTKGSMGKAMGWKREVAFREKKYFVGLRQRGETWTVKTRRRIAARTERTSSGT